MIGYIIALALVVFVFWDAITTIRWIRRQNQRDKNLLFLAMAATIVLAMSNLMLYLFKK